jgi:cobalt-zinc-cadmium efflux system outer membrane protein
MTLRAIAALSVTSVLVASTAVAQPASSFIDPAAGLSLDQAIARALADEPSLRAARLTIDVARAVERQAALRRNPSLSAEVRDEPSGSDHQATVSAEWPLDLFRRPGRITVASREVTASELAVADRERLLIAEVRARVGEVLVAVRDLAVLDELVDTVARQRDLLRARVEEGASPPLDRDLVDLELRRVNADRSLQLARVERAMLELKRTLGTAPEDALRLRDTLEEVVSRESSSAPPAAGGEARRADVREAAARVAVAEAKIDRAHRDGRFDVSVFAGYMRMDAGFPQSGVSPTGRLERVHGLFHYVTAGATVTLPMFNRNQGEVAAARAEHAQAAALQDAAVASAKIEIAAARSADRRTREAVRLYGGDAQALARANLSVIRQSYELGKTTILDVLAEQKRYLEFEHAYTDALRAAYEARTALTRAVGEIP